MARVKIKYPGPKDIVTKRRLFEVAASVNSSVIKLIDTNDAIIVITQEEKDADLFSSDALEKFKVSDYILLPVG